MPACLDGEVYRENESSILPVEKMYSYKTFDTFFLSLRYVNKIIEKISNTFSLVVAIMRTSLVCSQSLYLTAWYGR